MANCIQQPTVFMPLLFGSLVLWLSRPLIARHDWHVWTGWTLGSSFIMSILNIFNTLLFTHYTVSFTLDSPLIFGQHSLCFCSHRFGKVHLRTITCCSTMASKYVTFDGKTKVGVTQLFWVNWLSYVNWKVAFSTKLITPLFFKFNYNNFGDLATGFLII